MRLADAVGAALENVSEHKLRSGLTMLGMMFGVGAVIAMLSIGAGAERQALELIEGLGMRNVVIRAEAYDADKIAEIRKKSLGLSLRDVAAIDEAVPGVNSIAPRIEVEPYLVLARGAKSESSMYGVSRHYAALTNLRLAEGRYFDAVDERTHAQVAVIGAGTRRDLFGAGPAIGEFVKVNDVWFEIIGVLDPERATGASIEGVDLLPSSMSIHIPFTTALRKLDRDPLRSPLAEIVLHLDDRAAPYEVAAITNGLLDRLHGGVRDYEIIVPETLLEQSRQTQRLFNIVMGCIAGISLLVGGIGIMNIMLASVLEQTREIGIRRAVGATRADIRFQFLLTAFALSLIGGLAGVAIGLAIAQVVAAYAGWPTIVTAWAIALSTGVSVAVGLVSGLYPAIRAARLSPIEALRRE
jgi:putative ABC transport system permease protein